MPLPHSVRVKLSSEAAETIALTPVVVQELPVRDLVEHMLGVTGKDEPRIRAILLRGSLVAGASRFRWTGWDPDPDGLRDLLATFPDPDPARPFDATRCRQVTLRGGRQPIVIPRQAGERKSLFQRETFWDRLLSVIAGAPAVYTGYSYREKADRYTRALSNAETQTIRSVSDMVRYSTLRDQIQTVGFDSAEMLAGRG